MTEQEKTTKYFCKKCKVEKVVPSDLMGSPRCPTCSNSMKEVTKLLYAYRVSCGLGIGHIDFTSDYLSLPFEITTRAQHEEAEAEFLKTLGNKIHERQTQILCFTRLPGDDVIETKN